MIGEMSTIDTVLIIIAAVLFFLGGIASRLPPTPAVNWVAWGLFCLAVAMLPFF